MNSFRFWVLSLHHRLKQKIWTLASWAVLVRLLFGLGTIAATNLNSYRTGNNRGEERQEQLNWNGQAYIAVTPEAAQELQRFATDRNASAVEVYAIDYRLPGNYRGVWQAPSGSGPPRDRYASRTSDQWVLGQRSECSTSDTNSDLDPIERSINLEVYCPIGSKSLALPSGFIVLRWTGRRPSAAIVTDVQDELYDLGRLLAKPAADS
jgi:hypothetical protein